MKMDDIAMHYEIIVRRANGNCSRYDVAGADADIYRKLQYIFSTQNDVATNVSEFEKGETVGIIKAYLNDSIDRFIKMMPEKESRLSEIGASLINVDTLEQFDQIIIGLEGLTRE